MEAAGAAIDRAREAAIKPIVLVDPILGDEDKGLYVKPEVEAAVRAILVPRADVLAPNLWELNRITGADARDAEGGGEGGQDAEEAGAGLFDPLRGRIRSGVLYVHGAAAWLACHAKVVEVPKGAGDLLKALFAAGLIGAVPPQTALAKAVGGGGGRGGGGGGGGAGRSARRQPHGSVQGAAQPRHPLHPRVKARHDPRAAISAG